MPITQRIGMQTKTNEGQPSPTLKSGRRTPEVVDQERVQGPHPSVEAPPLRQDGQAGTAQGKPESKNMGMHAPDRGRGAARACWPLPTEAD
eukprot:scaffold59130_cov21-Tisochrysis_lutea.AAC.3